VDVDELEAVYVLLVETVVDMVVLVVLVCDWDEVEPVKVTVLVRVVVVDVTV
jgi:hypothetical protein